MFAVVTTALLGGPFLLYLVYRKLVAAPDLSHIPLANTDTDRFLHDANGLISEGLQKYNGKPFRMTTPMGERVLLPAKFVDAIKSDDRMSFDEFVVKFLAGDKWGFEAIHEAFTTGILRDVVRIKLTQNLSRATKDLATEVTHVLGRRWGHGDEYHDVDLGNDVLALVSRMSTRVFLGEELAHNQEWLDIAINFSLMIFTAARSLREWPKLLQPIANVFLPTSRTLRACGARAKAIIDPIVQIRRIERLKPGYNKPNDTLDWADDISKGRKYDPTKIQLALTMAAIHTTSDLMKTAILALAQHPEVLPELRKEICEVLPTSGWDKVSMHKLELLDSAIKEAQRLKPGGIAPMERVVMEDFLLPDGTLLPKGTPLNVSASRMWDRDVHQNPEKYDAHRFVKIRHTPGLENTGQLVTTGADHLAFGHGKHACPGRFFAANEVKIAVAYIVMNYDIRLSGTQAPQPMRHGIELLADPVATIQVRKRAPELDLDAL